MIPSVSAHHSGKYTCMDFLSTLYVYHICSCIRYPSISITIFQGEEVFLECAPRPKDLPDDQILTRWYRKRPTESEAPILDSENTSVLLPLDLADRLSVSEPNLALITLLATPENAGVFRCRVWASYPRTFCHERIIILQNDDKFYMRMYSLLVSCALLILVSIVITVSVKRRGGHQVNGKAEP